MGNMKECGNCGSEYPLDREHFYYRKDTGEWSASCNECRLAHRRKYSNAWNAGRRGPKVTVQDPELMSFIEIAARLGMTPVQVRRAYYSALSKLRKRFPDLRDQVILANERDPDARYRYRRPMTSEIPISQYALIPNPKMDHVFSRRRLDRPGRNG